MMRLNAQMHRARAAEHSKLGMLMLDTRHEWAAVALFYAAYHQVKAALLEDAIFDDLKACQAKHPNLHPDDRYATSHQTRKGTHGALGVNDVASIIYPGAFGHYERLHQLSINVRYGTGLPPGAIYDVRQLYEDFMTLVDAGGLSSGAAPEPA